MSDVIAAANPIKLPKSCRMEAFAAPMNQAAKPEGETTIFYHQAQKKPLLGADKELPTLDNL
jgi:hypothetical protein